MDPVPSRPRRLRRSRGLPRLQRGGWLSQELQKPPGYDLAQRLTRKYENPLRRRRPTSRQRRGRYQHAQHHVQSGGSTSREREKNRRCH